jgi:galactokinase
MSSRRGRAPGRLDLMGGVADYSGALVLEIPTRQGTEVVAQPDDALVVGQAVIPPPELERLAGLPYAEVRRVWAEYPRWTLYLLGVALVLVRHAVIAAPRVRLEVSSDLPTSVGVASSAALEVATARALGADVAPLVLASLCQEAENQIVGAPCGVMDQVAVVAGRPGAILPVLCRPASVEAPLPLPRGLEVVGWPSGAEHDVGGRPYRRARAAAFMGKRIVEQRAGRSWAWTSQLPRAATTDLPELIDGATFLERWGDTDDPLTSIEPGETYPVRAATSFGGDEHARSMDVLASLAAGEPGRLGHLMESSNAGYSAMGLGHPAAAAAVAEAMVRPGVHGARSSGGGCGGTVVVVCDRGALDDVAGLIH